jgi:hypothetical protein
MNQVVVKVELKADGTNRAQVPSRAVPDYQSDEEEFEIEFPNVDSAFQALNQNGWEFVPGLQVSSGTHTLLFFRQVNPPKEDEEKDSNWADEEFVDDFPG